MVVVNWLFVVWFFVCVMIIWLVRRLMVWEIVLCCFLSVVILKRLVGLRMILSCGFCIFEMRWNVLLVEFMVLVSLGLILRLMLCFLVIMIVFVMEFRRLC